jgi:dihydrofolate reductase
VTTQYYTASSLDGFIADRENSLSWLLQFDDEAEEESDYPGFIAEVGALAMGSTTYEWIANELGFVEDPGKWPYEQPTWVFSSRELPRPDGRDVRFVRGDVAPVHAEMASAAAGRNVWLVGGGDLVGQFHDAGLLDEIIVTMAPVTLGAGAPLLPRRIATPPLRLVDAKASGEVFVTLRYRVQRT